MPTKPRVLRTGNLTEGEKLQVYDKHKREPKLTQKALAEWCRVNFGLEKAPVQATISNILRRFSKSPAITIAPDRKTNRTVTYPELDEALALWVNDKQANNVPISDELIQTKARQLFEALKERGVTGKEITFSAGWLTAFKGRHDFKRVRLHGEGASANSEAVVGFFTRIQPKLDTYSAADIFNFDETGLFYRRRPTTTIGKGHAALRGSKKDKTRLTVGLAVNMDGSCQLEPLFIGHAKKPRAFKKKLPVELGFSHYYFNKSAWMTTVIFRRWLEKVNTSMLRQDRKILLLIDNATSHLDVELSHIEIVFLPPNATAILQPLDGGIIGCFKAHYRRLQFMHAVAAADRHEEDWFKVDILTAIRWVKLAWNEVSTETIVNCWRKSGFSCDFSTSTRVYPLSVRRSLEESVADIVQAIQVLQLSNCSSVDAILNPPGENDVHLAYTDSDVIDMVVGIEDEDINEDGEEEQQLIPSDGEFADAVDVVLRKLMAENDSSEALSITRSFLSKSLFEYNKNKLVQKKQQLITSHFKPV